MDTFSPDNAKLDELSTESKACEMEFVNVKISTGHVDINTSAKMKWHLHCR